MERKTELIKQTSYKAFSEPTALRLIYAKLKHRACLFAILVFFGFIVSAFMFTPVRVHAEPNPPAGNSKNNTESSQVTPDRITNEERKKLADCTPDHAQECLKANPLVQWSQTLVKLLGMGVGVVVTIMIIIGGIQYAAAGPNPQAVSAAKKKIANAIIALIAYFFLFAFLQWLVPGGIL